MANIWTVLGSVGKIVGDINDAINEIEQTGIMPEPKGSVKVGSLKGRAIRLKVTVEVDK